MMTHTASRPNCRHQHMPAVELGLIINLNDVPIVLARLRDPDVVRGVVEAAIQAAQQRDDVAGRQEVRMLTGILAQT